jgi:hypothetical protein
VEQRKAVVTSKRYAAYDEYGFRHLSQHLARSGRNETLREMLFDFGWLQAKLNATDANALIADYGLLPDDPELRPVRDALRLSASILDQEKAQLATQLTGRLMTLEAPAIQAILKQARQAGVVPWLRPLTPGLTSPGGPLLRTLRGHSYQVNAVVVTPDGQQVVSGSLDKTVKV